MELKVGMKIYNHGDQANSPHFGTITKISDRVITITPEDGLNPYRVDSYDFKDEYKGNGLTRLVTAAAYDKWFNAEIEKLPESIKK